MESAAGAQYTIIHGINVLPMQLEKVQPLCGRPPCNPPLRASNQWAPEKFKKGDGGRLESLFQPPPLRRSTPKAGSLFPDFFQAYQRFF